MSKKVLLVDDAAFMRKMLGGILSKNGFEIVGEAGDGNEAVRLYKETNPDFVMLDITMPEKDGIEALVEIMDFDPEATVIMCSAMSQDNMVSKALQSGAKDFIIKPFKPDQIIEVINKLELN